MSEIQDLIQKFIQDGKITQEEIDEMVESYKQNNVTLKDLTMMLEMSALMQNIDSFTMNEIQSLKDENAQLRAEVEQLKENQGLISAKLKLNIFSWGQ